MQVFVRLENGKMISIEVSPMDTIDNIKMKICDKEGLHPESFILQHGSMEVEEGRTLNDYDIRNEATLYLKEKVLRRKCAVIRILFTDKVTEVRSAV